MAVKITGPLVGRFSEHKVRVQFVADVHTPQLRLLGEQGQALATLYLELRGDEIILGVDYNNHPNVGPDAVTLADLRFLIPF